MSRLKRSKRSSSQITKYLPIFLILFSVTIILGSTFAYFMDKNDKVGIIDFGKVELSSETEVGYNGIIYDALPGAVVVDSPLIVAKSIDSEPILLRAKLSFSVNGQTNDKIDEFLLQIQLSDDFGIETIEQNGAKWSERIGNYYYLVSSLSETEIFKVTDTYTYTFCDKLRLPTSLEASGDEVYFESINYHFAFQTIQAENLGTLTFEEVHDLFNSVFPEREEEKIPMVVNFSDSMSESIYSTQYVRRGSKVIEPIAEPSKEGYAFDNWYADPELTILFDFNAEINENTKIYAKWNELIDVNYYDDNNVLQFTDKVAKGGIIENPLKCEEEGYLYRHFTASDYSTLFDFENTIINESVDIYYKKAFDLSEEELSYVNYQLYSSGATKYYVVGDGNKGTGFTASRPETYTDLRIADYYSSPDNDYGLLRVREVKSYAFSETNITSVSTQYPLYSLGSYAFNACKQLTEVNIENGLYSISSYCFQSIPNLSYVYIPESVKSLGSFALSSVQITEVETDRISLSDRNSLGNIIYFKNISKISNVFLWTMCENVIYNYRRTITTNPEYDYIVFEENGEEVCYLSKAKNITPKMAVPEYIDNIKVVGLFTRCFADCVDLYELTLPNTIKYIGRYAFEDCSNVDITLTDSIEIIGLAAFDGCRKMLNFEPPKNLLYLGQAALSNTTVNANTIIFKEGFLRLEVFGLNTYLRGAVYIPKSTEYAYVSNSYGLYAYFEGSEEDSPFNGNCMGKYYNCKLYTYGDYTYTIVNDSEVHILKYTGNESEIIIPNEIDGLPVTFTTTGTFASDSLRYLKLSENTKTIPGYFLYRCRNVEELVIPEGLERIEKYALYYASGLKKLTLPSTLTYIGEDPFFDADFLHAIVPNNVTEFGGQWVFNENYNLRNLFMPSSIATFGGYPAVIDCPYVTIYTDWENAEAVTWSSNWNSRNYTVVYNCEPINYNGYIGVHNKDTNSIELWDYNGDETYLNIPSDIDGIPVTTLGKYFCGYNKNITKVTIPNSVTTIKTYAFLNCYNIIEVEIPDSVTTLESGVFSGCKKVVHVINFSGKTFSSLSSCTGREILLTEGEFANPIETIDGKQYLTIGSEKYLINVIGNITNLVIDEDENVTQIYNHAVRENRYITSVTLPSTIKIIGEYAFYNCYNLSSITMVNGVTEIMQYAFYGCDLKSLYLYDSVTKLGNYSFANNYNLSELRISENLTTINSYCFNNNSISNLIIPQSVTTIQSYAFDGCKNLSEINIPKNLTSIGSSAFANCGLTYIFVDNQNSKFTSRDLAGNEVNCLIDIANKTIIQGADNAIIPSDGSVTTIGSYSFKNVLLGDLLILAEYITKIQTYAFYGSDIEKVEIFGTLTTFDSYAFSSCSNLKEFILHGGTMLPNNCFESCPSLKVVVLPDTITSIGSYCFRYCYSLEEFKIPSECVTISSYAFGGCSLLSIVEWNEKLKTIGLYAFNSCVLLNNVYLHSSIETISSNVFLSCMKLNNVYLNNSQIVAGITSDSSYGWILDYCHDLYIQKDLNEIAVYITNNYVLQEGIVEVDGVEYYHYYRASV